MGEWWVGKPQRYLGKKHGPFWPRLLLSRLSPTMKRLHLTPKAVNLQLIHSPGFSFLPLFFWQYWIELRVCVCQASDRPLSYAPAPQHKLYWYLVAMVNAQNVLRVATVLQMFKGEVIFHIHVAYVNTQSMCLLISCLKSSTSFIHPFSFKPLQAPTSCQV